MSGGVAGIARIAGGQRRAFHPVFPVLLRVGPRDWHDRAGVHDRDVLLVLPDAPALREHGGAAAGVDVQALLLAVLPRAIRPALRRVPARAWPFHGNAAGLGAG